MKDALIKALRSASNAVAGNVGGPVDLISMGLRGVGVPVPQNAIGGSDWMRQHGLLSDVPMGPERIVGETLGLLGPTVIAQKAPQIVRGLLQGAENLAAPSVANKQIGAIDFSNRDGIRKAAEEFAEKARAQGWAAQVEHSGSIAGPSSYVRLFDNETGKYITKPFRFSGHGKGPREATGVISVLDDSSFNSLLEQASGILNSFRSGAQKRPDVAMNEVLPGLNPAPYTKASFEAFKEARDTGLPFSRVKIK